MADPELQIRSGAGHPDPEIRGGGGEGLKIFFWPFGPHFGLKIKEGPAPPAPSPGSPTVLCGEN